MAKPGEEAKNRATDRQEEMCRDFRLVDLKVNPDEVFEQPRPQDSEHIIHVSTKSGRAKIVVARDVAGLLNGEVILDLKEVYSYADRAAGRARTWTPRDYSYTLSYLPEMTIDPRQAGGNAADHWGPILLTQRKFFRFDGPLGEPKASPPDASDLAKLKHRNQHPLHHLHPCSERHLRFPVARAPTILAVACFAMISFDYERWVEFARRDARVLNETRLILPYVELPG